MMNSTPIIEQAPGMGGFAATGLGEDSVFGESGGTRATFPNGVRRTGPDFDVPVAASSQTNGQIEDFDEVSDVALFDFDFHSQVEAASFSMAPEHQDELYEIAALDPFLNDFPQETPNGIFGIVIPGQEIDFSRRLEINPNVPSASPETSFFSNDYDQNTPNDIFSDNFPGQETDFSNNLEINAHEPSASQETSFSSNKFDQDNISEICAIERRGEDGHRLGSFETDSNSPSASEETSFSSNDFNLTPIPNTPSPSSPATTPCSSSNSLDRHLCPHCSATFKRLGDVKRHKKVHLPGQRKFHCWQAGCERNGRKGFYRRDKLRDHEKQVHGS